MIKIIDNIKYKTHLPKVKENKKYFSLNKNDENIENVDYHIFKYLDNFYKISAIDTALAIRKRHYKYHLKLIKDGKLSKECDLRKLTIKNKYLVKSKKEIEFCKKLFK